MELPSCCPRWAPISPPCLSDISSAQPLWGFATNPVAPPPRERVLVQHPGCKSHPEPHSFTPQRLSAFTEPTIGCGGLAKIPAGLGIGVIKTPSAGGSEAGALFPCRPFLGRC